MFLRWNSWQSQTKRQYFFLLYTFSLSFGSKEFVLPKKVAFFFRQWFFHGNFSVTGPIIGIIHLNEKMMRFTSWKWILSLEIENITKQNHWFQTTMNIFSQRESDEKKKKKQKKENFLNSKLLGSLLNVHNHTIQRDREIAEATKCGFYLWLLFNIMLNVICCCVEQWCRKERYIYFRSVCCFILLFYFHFFFSFIHWKRNWEGNGNGALCHWIIWNENI